MSHAPNARGLFAPSRRALRCALALALSLGCGDGDNAQNAEAMDPEEMGDEACVNTCVEGERSCLNELFELKCELQPSGCRAYSKQATRCPAGQSCSRTSGACEGLSEPQECVSNCDSGDPPRCSAKGEVERCALRDGQDCFTYEVSATCEGEEVCQGGECGAPSCSSAACTLGQTQCEGKQLRSCEMINGCAVFAPATDCPDGQRCEAESCRVQASCEDVCILDQDRLCTPAGAPRLCERTAEGCTAYVDKPDCGSGEECDKGNCVLANVCVNSCEVGQRRCTAGDAVEICEETAGETCPTWVQLEDCGGNGLICDGTGAQIGCAMPPMSSASILINEILYNVSGADADATGSRSFIELKGAPGQSMAGWELRLVNGSTGQTYETLTLPMNAAIGSYGYAVITTTRPVPFLIYTVAFGGAPIYDLIPATMTNDGFQNGPDNVELYDASGSLVDALGYGDFGPNDLFTGEGLSPGRVLDDRSLGRLPGALDSDDNSVDFISLFPTPGQPNGDLIINELYVDQPGADGQSGTAETFIELLAPEVDASWIDMSLEQYTLRFINGNDDMDYISSGPNPGVDFAGVKLHDLVASNPASEGLVVVCNINAAPSVLARCSEIYSGVDFQNGPDSVVLEYRGRVIDAVAYGSFSGSQIPRGEGAPAPFTSMDEGKSLNRLNISGAALDTDDNAFDFYLDSPSPGVQN